MVRRSGLRLLDTTSQRRFWLETTRAQVAIMWQNLLKDRLAVTVHCESTEFRVYELAVARGGPKNKRDRSTPGRRVVRPCSCLTKDRAERRTRHERNRFDGHGDANRDRDDSATDGERVNEAPTLQGSVVGPHTRLWTSQDWQDDSILFWNSRRTRRAFVSRASSAGSSFRLTCRDESLRGRLRACATMKR